MCFNNCSIKARVVNGVVMEIAGNEDSPIGRGHLCGKGASGIMQLYDPNRVTKPMKRTNPNKGMDQDPQWQEISWDEAYSLIDEKIKEAVAKGPFSVIKASAVASLHGSCYSTSMLSVIYDAAFQGSNSDVCGAGVHQVSYMFTAAGNAMPDYKYCNYLIQFGTQAGTATRHGYNMTTDIFAQRRVEGMKLVNFDPHMSAGAEKADIWAAIRPGTDGAAALAIAYVLVHELDLIDKEYLTLRTNGPALVDTATGRIIRSPESKKALFMDIDGSAKPYDEATEPQLEGSFMVDGKAVTTGFSLYKEHIKTYTPEYCETITTIPATTLRQIAKEFGEAACIGQTIEIDGVTLPYRPACVDCFSGVSRHKHAMHSFWNIMFLNVLVGSANQVGGLIGYAPICHGWSDDNPNAGWDVTIWEEDGFIEGAMLIFALPHSYYQIIRNSDYTPTDLALMALLPLADDPHFAFMTQAHPDIYHTEDWQPSLMFVYASNPLKWWGNSDEQARIYANYDYVIGMDIYLNDSSYYYDLFIPEASYLERHEVLPVHFLNHRNIGGVDEPWPVTIWQPVVDPVDGLPGNLEFFAELAERNGKTAYIIGLLNALYRVKEEYSVPMDQKLDIEAFIDSVLKSNIDVEHGLEWLRANNGVYTYPRKVDEVYIWANDKPGRVPLYWDFMFEAKEKVAAKIAELDIPWEFDDYQPLPDWKPCVDYAITNPEYDILPIYYTSAINTDSWLLENPWINEINEDDPSTYGIEINSATAKAKGLSSGDTVRLTNKDGVSVEGRLVVSECVHPECVAVQTGSWGAKSKMVPFAYGKGVPLVDLIPGQDPSRLDHVCAAFDQCVRVKIERIV
jgi:molybdopterin-containing oxidoreductase family molybdopterin binding subunit